MLRNLVLIGMMLCCATTAHATDVVMREIPQAKIVGKAAFSVVFWDVYDATLYAPEGVLRADAPFALSLEYKRKFSGKDIAERSVKEMRGQGFTNAKKLTAWQKEMESIFPDVKAGTMLTAIFYPDAATAFYQNKNNQPIGTVEDAEFTRQFSAIWLSEKTSEPEMRKKLLGLR